MPATLTEEEFSKHLHTRFRITSTEPIELELTQVKGYLSKEHEETGMERFSAFFLGLSDRYLPQATYSVEHEAMGDFELFLVPVAQDEKGFRYEAVFNYFKA
ncbi:MAG TPA: hypothetical protein VGJ37_04185 [Pyrinomonadaceae bacterium]|jgi:hypothetical protein